MNRLIHLVAMGVVVAGTVLAGPPELGDGLIVRFGCEDAAGLAELAAKSRLVHGLVADAGKLQAIRQELAGKGMAGRVNAAYWGGGALPYVDGLVNAVIVTGDGRKKLPDGELERMLAPRGIVLENGKVVYTKPVPASIDDWTHYLHDPGNNAVAQDTEIGPPRHMQWIGGPRWSRHHDHLASINALVSEQGKLFYIIDEGSNASILMPPDWKLIARDAFNGVVLWKRDIAKWWPHLWPLKSGPASMPRRLVAEGAEVYMPQTVLDPVIAMEAATGRVVREYPGSEGAEELIVIGDTLLALTNPTQPGVDSAVGSLGPEVENNAKVWDSRISKAPVMQHYWAQVKSKLWLESGRTIKAYQASTGKKLWEYASLVAPLTMAATEKKVYFHNSDEIVALNIKTGFEAFRTEPVAICKDFMLAFFGATLVVYNDVIVFAGGEKLDQAWMGWGKGKEQGQDTMTAFSATTGAKMWEAPHPYGGYQSPEDLLIADDLIWVADTAVGGAPGTWKGHNYKTGKVEKEIPPTLKTRWFHHRCYRAKATVNFLLPSRNGVEFIDIEKREWGINHWVRSACLYGIMPANGLLYNAPHNCACHPQAKLNGLNALARATASRAIPGELEPALVKGPAFGKVKASATDGGWPTYRGALNRGGTTVDTVSPELKRAWKARVVPESSTGERRLTQPVVQGDLMVVAAIESNTVHALDARSGKGRWTHVAGGRVDSVPTLAGGYAVFGSADGYVTALRAEDGEMAWRFRAAPVDRRIVSFGQVESSWPVNGSVLVDKGEAMFVAGRSFHLDGGAFFYRLDLATGDVKVKKCLDKHRPDGTELQAKGGLDMPVALTDILSADGDTVYMRSLLLDRNGERSSSTKHHLFAPYGFTDSDWFHRAYWVFGKTYMGGCGGYSRAGKIFPSGKMIVFDEDQVYAYGREMKYFRWISPMEFRLFAAQRPDKPAPAPAKTGGAKDGEAPKKGRKKQKATPYKQSWSVKVPILVRAMAKAADILFLAGPPDLMDEEDVLLNYHLKKTAPIIREQNESYCGRQGALVWAVDAKTGTKLAEYKLAEVPAFDGMSAAVGKLYISTTGGELICFE